MRWLDNERTIHIDADRCPWHELGSTMGLEGEQGPSWRL